MPESQKVREEMVPIVTLTLSSMKHAIMQMLDPNQMRQAIEQRLNSAIQIFDFETKVRREAEKCISQSITDYFQYGQGKDIITKAVQAALTETLINMQQQLSKEQSG